ncbi:amidohydrolase family protein [Nitrospira sp. M1]
MKYMPAFVLCVLIAISIHVTPEGYASDSSSTDTSPKVYAFTNGQWFDGRTFQDTIFYVKNGLLTKTRPQVVDETINLNGQFVLPPFGEAHTHNVEGPWNIDHTILTYLQHGIFYVKNLNNIREFSEQIQDKINSSQSIDVAFAHGGLTSTTGHPIALYENLLRLHRYEPIIGKKAQGWFNNRAYFVIDSNQDLDRTWPKIIAGKPDFLKIYIGQISPVAPHAHAPQAQFHRGLHANLIDPIVRRAHKNGLRVSAHVETAADFRQAVLRGVDEVAHTPGWYLPTVKHASATILQKHDADLALQHNVTVVSTTVAGAFPPAGHHQHGHASPHADDSHARGNHQKPTQQPIQQTAETIQRDNLQLLHRQGVKIAIGSDHAETSRAEALHLHDLGIFDNLTLLKLWCENTAATIFPHRKIGRLTEGYEANFIVLQGNPIQDFEQIRHITLRVKQGKPLFIIDPYAH